MIHMEIDHCCGCDGTDGICDQVVPPHEVLPQGCGWVPNIGSHEWEMYCDCHGVNDEYHDRDKPHDHGDHGHNRGSFIYLEEYISPPIYYPPDTLLINLLDACDA